MMSCLHPNRLGGAALLACLLLGVAGAVGAKDFQAGPIKISAPWTRATPKGAQVGGGYLTVVNTGSTADKLLGGSLSGASRVEIHEMTMDGGVMRMHPVSGGGLEIKPGEAVTLKPGGFHMMFTGLTAPLTQGGTVAGTLIFEKAGTVPVEFSVEGLAAQSPSAGGPSSGVGDTKGMGGMKGM